VTAPVPPLPGTPPMPSSEPGSSTASPAAPVPESAAAPAPELWRGQRLDRVGGSRLTGIGAVLLAVIVTGAVAPPQAADRQIMVIIWAALIAMFLVGVPWPLVAVRRIQVRVTSPRDATVGDHVPIAVELHGRRGICEIRALDPTGPWHRATVAGSGTLAHLADRRGVFQVMRVEVRVTAPLGLLAAHRVHAVELSMPVEVAPRPLQVSWRPAPAPVTDGATPFAFGRPGGDLVRSVRPYTTGDPSRLVHWPSSARAGTLVIREMEPPAPLGQALVLDLRDLTVDVERAASYAFGAARAVLGTGGQLVLCTCEASGPVTAAVRSPLDAGRRLARAVVGPPGEPPEGWPLVEIGR